MSDPTFHEIQFPVDYAGGLSGGPMYSNRVIVADSGGEVRTQMWDNARLQYQIEYTSDPDGMAMIRAFFRARKGRVYGWRFKDWSDFQAFAEVLVAGATMQLQKTYDDGFGTEIRKITKPCNNGTFQLFDNGVPVTSSVDWTTGIVTPTLYHAGHAYTWTGEFDVPVRFDVDKLTFIQESVGRQSLQAIPIVEVLM